jgi:hypothetical protein
VAKSTSACPSLPRIGGDDDFGRAAPIQIGDGGVVVEHTLGVSTVVVHLRPTAAQGAVVLVDPGVGSAKVNRREGHNPGWLHRQTGDLEGNAHGIAVIKVTTIDDGDRRSVGTFHDIIFTGKIQMLAVGLRRAANLKRRNIGNVLRI